MLKIDKYFLKTIYAYCNYSSIRTFLAFFLIWIPGSVFASYIETTIGTAVVNDATAAYYNPAALTLLKNWQFIPLLNLAKFHTQFSGNSTVVSTNFTESGTSSTTTNYYSPSFYIGIPVSKKIIMGIAAVSNFVNRNPEEQAILRYMQSSNKIQDYDLVPAVGIKINDYFALGANVNLSQLNLNLHPLLGFPGSNIPDSQSHNQSEGSGIGMGIGGLLSPNPSTLIGLNYRTVTTYNESGVSEINNVSHICSKNYHFQVRTPARTTFTISQSINTRIRMITTIQRIQWSIIRNINVYNMANLSTNAKPVIINNATIPQYLENTWAFTLGGQYLFLPKWVIRLAGTYNQSPYSGRYQISNGDSYVLGASMGYNFNKSIKIDGSYAHVFMNAQTIDINGKRFIIDGTNNGSRDAVSLKITVNII